LSQNRYISPPCGGAICQPICTTFGECVDLVDVITPAEFGFNIFIGLSKQRCGKKHFPVRKQTAYTTVLRAGL